MVLAVGTAGAVGDAAGGGVVVEGCEDGPVADGVEDFEHATATSASAIAETASFRSVLAMKHLLPPRRERATDGV